MTHEPTSEPSPGRVIRTLNDGYWADGSRRVRKRCKGASMERPWGVESLRREIRYLKTLPPRAAAVLPPLLAGWDQMIRGVPDVGYEMPFYPDHRDAGSLALAGALSQTEINLFQQELAEAVLARLHEPAGGHESLSAHMVGVVRQAFDGLVPDPAYAALIEADAIELNDRRALGPRAVFERIVRETDMLAVIDGTPAVRLHGDLHLENILWRPLANDSNLSLREGPSGGPPKQSSWIATARDGEPRDDPDKLNTVPRLLLIDPVSVAGVTFGLPLWDLVKYESYATGELMALRTERIEVGGIGEGSGCYRCRICTEHTPFLTLSWHAVFRTAFEKRHGRVDERAYHFIHGYFNAAMALNTSGIQRQGRLLRATEDFNAVLG